MIDLRFFLMYLSQEGVIRFHILSREYLSREIRHQWLKKSNFCVRDPIVLNFSEFIGLP